MKILIATDGSRFSAAAIEKCADMIAKPEDMQINLISVYERLGPMAGEPFGVSTEYYNEAENAAKKLAVEAVKRANDALQSRFPDMKLNVSTTVERGRAARVIVELAGEWKADLVVLGSHGSGFWERSLLGSVSDAVVHHAPCSVLVVRTPSR